MSHRKKSVCECFKKVSEDKNCRSETFCAGMMGVTVRYRCLYENNNTMRIDMQLLSGGGE